MKWYKRGMKKKVLPHNYPKHLAWCQIIAIFFNSNYS